MIESKTNYFDLFGISEDATERDIKKAYVKMLRMYPHDQYPEEFQLITLARDTLIDPQLRERYVNVLYGVETISDFYEQAKQAYDANDYVEADRLIERALNEQAHNVEMLLFAISIANELHDEAKKQAYIHLLKTNYVHNLEVKRFLAKESLRSKDYINAVLFAEQVWTIGPKLQEDLLLLLTVYSQNRQILKYKAVLLKELGNSPSADHYHIIVNGLKFSANHDDTAFAQELLTKLKQLTFTIGKGDVLYLLEQTITALPKTDFSYKLFLDIATELNENEFTDLQRWIDQERALIGQSSFYFDLYKIISHEQPIRDLPLAKKIDLQLTEAELDTHRLQPSNSILRLVWAFVFGLTGFIVSGETISVAAGSAVIGALIGTKKIGYLLSLLAVVILISVLYIM